MPLFLLLGYLPVRVQYSRTSQALCLAGAWGPQSQQTCRGECGVCGSILFATGALGLEFWLHLVHFVVRKYQYMTAVVSQVPLCYAPSSVDSYM